MSENKIDIKTMVGGGKKVRLERYQSGNLTYVTETGFRFHVPVEELGDAPAYPEDNAMAYMKWIKRAIAAAESEDDGYSTGEVAIRNMRVLTIEDVQGE